MSIYLFIMHHCKKYKIETISKGGGDEHLAQTAAKDGHYVSILAILCKQLETAS